ncbi:hypothetical protein K466DRAFT_139071 [Polyporus arcularius HHB13444]|uniref:Secreted protein n=1 Tax=Polyporus arcularius HHB13444 TaxID=1314778 RepID=A0A5C3PAS3_9APHY|nr:hypothetical protein K466DRAFT_139071 [Polyporus arcularius HHB13444]
MSMPCSRYCCCCRIVVAVVISGVVSPCSPVPYIPSPSRHPKSTLSWHVAHPASAASRFILSIPSILPTIPRLRLQF